MPSPRNPMPNGSATCRSWFRCDCSSVQVWCTVSTGAPESSNWPPGSSEMAPPPATSSMPIRLPASRIGSQPSRCCIPSSSARMLRSPSYGTGSCRPIAKANFSCSVPMRNSDLGLQPAARYATSSSRVSTGVISIWSRAIRNPKGRGRDLTREPSARATLPAQYAQGKEPLAVQFARECSPRCVAVLGLDMRDDHAERGGQNSRVVAEAEKRHNIRHEVEREDKIGQRAHERGLHVEGRLVIEGAVIGSYEIL